MMPRKNGKTELCAALAIDGLLFDGEMGAEVYSAAADKDQAALVFNVAAQMIRNDPELLAACEIIDSQKRIVHRKSGSVYRAISRRGVQQARVQRVARDLRRAARRADARAVGRAGDEHGRAGAAAGDRDLDGRLRPAFDPVGAVPAREARPGDAGDRSDVPAGDLRGAGRRRLDRRARLAPGEPRARGFPLARGDARRLRARAGDPGAGSGVPAPVSEPVDRTGRALDRAGGLGRLPGAGRSRPRSPAGAATSAWTSARRPT